VIANSAPADRPNPGKTCRVIAWLLLGRFSRLPQWLRNLEVKPHAAEPQAPVSKAGIFRHRENGMAGIKPADNPYQ